MHQGLTLASDSQVTRSQDTRVAGCSALEGHPQSENHTRSVILRTLEASSSITARKRVFLRKSTGLKTTRGVVSCRLLVSRRPRAAELIAIKFAAVGAVPGASVPWSNGSRVLCESQYGAACGESRGGRGREHRQRKSRQGQVARRIAACQQARPSAGGGPAPQPRTGRHRQHCCSSIHSRSPRPPPGPVCG